MGHALERLGAGRAHPLASDAGFNTLWQPGYDHAGIALQVAVMTRRLAAEGKTLQDVGRETFVEL